MTTLIFLADDDADDVELFCEAVNDIDTSVIVEFFCNGLEMLNKLNNQSPTHLPELIFLDVNMPGMNGWQCLTHLKQQVIYQHIPVVLYSTSSLAQEKVQALQLGAHTFITKPNDYATLKKRVREILERVKVRV